MNKKIEMMMLRALPVLKRYGISKVGIFGSYANVEIERIVILIC